MSKLTWLKLSIFVFVFSFIIFRAANISCSQVTLRSSGEGDGPTEIAVVSAVKYFTDFGFWASKLRPIHGYAVNRETKDVHAYTHYPAGPDLTTALWVKLSGVKTEFGYRILPILLSVFLFFFIYWSLEKYLKNKQSAFLSASLIVLSNYFLAWADNIHKFLYEEVFKWVGVYLIFLYFDKTRIKTKTLRIFYLISLFFISFWLMNLSFETPVYFGILVLTLALFYEKKFYKSPICWVVFLGSLLGFFTHFGLNVLYYESFDLAYNDLLTAFHRRTGNCAAGAECFVSSLDFLKIPLIFLNRFEHYFLVPGGAVLYFAYLSLLRFKNENIFIFKFSLATILATLSWYFVMPQHAQVHSFVGRQAAIAFGLFVGPGIMEYRNIFLNHMRKGMSLRLATFHLILFSYVFGMAITQQIWHTYYLKTFTSLR